MEEKHVFDNMDIIRRVYDILKKENALTNYTLRIKMSFFKNLSEEDYKRIDYNLKAIRQDYAKMLVIMNSIDRTYAAYKKDEYIPTYYSNYARVSSHRGQGKQQPHFFYQQCLIQSNNLLIMGRLVGDPLEYQRNLEFGRHEGLMLIHV